MKFKRFWAQSLALARVQIKLRHENSLLGIFWYLLNPLLMFSLLLTIFSIRAGNQIENYPIYLILGLIIFGFFSQATIEATKIIRINSSLIRSVNFSKSALVNSLVLKTLFSHIFEIILLTIIIIIFNGSLIGLIFYPLVLILLSLFTYGISLIFASLAVYFTDIEGIWTFASRLIWLGTPIFYAIEGQTKLFYLNILNPLYYFITITREIIINLNMPSPWIILGCIAYTLLSLIIGLTIFNSLKNKMAEKI